MKCKKTLILRIMVSFEDLSHRCEESLLVNWGANSLIGNVNNPIELVELVKSLLHGITGQVIDNAEVNFSLHYSVLRVKDDLLYHISGC